jgi:hypothetical protein
MCSTNEKRSSGKCVVQSFSGLLPRISCYAINYLGVNMTAALQARRTCSGILRRAMADIVRSCAGALHYSSQRPYHVPCRGSKRGRQSHAMLVVLEIAHPISAGRTTYRESVAIRWETYTFVLGTYLHADADSGDRVDIQSSVLDASEVVLTRRPALNGSTSTRVRKN